MNAAQWHIDVDAGNKSHEEMFRRFENTSLYFIDNINNNELEQLINKLISNV